jgi:hypothetical protein
MMSASEAHLNTPDIHQAGTVIRQFRGNGRPQETVPFTSSTPLRSTLTTPESLVYGKRAMFGRRSRTADLS